MIRHWLASMLGLGVFILTLAFTGCGATRGARRIIPKALVA